MKKREIFIILSIFIVLLILSNSSFAEKAMRNMISVKFSEQRDICLVVRSLIQEGKYTKEVVKTTIEMGYSACLVTKCAIEAGGNLEDIINGAIEAGATSDVIARCTIDAGGNPEEVARILEQSPATISDLPEGDRGGGRVEEPEEPVLSPSSP